MNLSLKLEFLKKKKNLKGYLFTRGPGTYKIPSSNDVPIDFR